MSLPSLQSVSELTFELFERPVHPELFDIYASRRFFQGDYEAILWVTGCSHVVQVFIDGECLAELISTPEQLLPRHGRRESFPFKGERTYACTWAGGLRYMMAAQVEKMSENLYRHTLQDLKETGKKRGMLVTHANEAKDELAPLSYVDFVARVEELQVHTWHALPEQQTVLKTQSLFKLG